MRNASTKVHIIATIRLPGIKAFYKHEKKSGSLLLESLSIRY